MQAPLILSHSLCVSGWDPKESVLLNRATWQSIHRQNLVYCNPCKESKELFAAHVSGWDCPPLCLLLVQVNSIQTPLLYQARYPKTPETVFRPPFGELFSPQQLEATGSPPK